MENVPSASPGAVAALIADTTHLRMLKFATLRVQNIFGDDDLLFDGKPVEIDIFSPGSAEGVRASHKAAGQEQLRSMGLIRGRMEKNIGEVTDREECAKLVSITKEIRNWNTDAAALYADTDFLYITKQVQRFYGELANFGKPSTPTLASTSANSPG